MARRLILDTGVLIAAEWGRASVDAVIADSVLCPQAAHS